MQMHVAEWELSRLVPYERNPRLNDPHVDKMVASIREYGFRIPIIATSDGQIVDGHLRYKAALVMGLEAVPVIMAEGLTDAQVTAFRIMANKSVEWSRWDDELLRLELSTLEELGSDLLQTGFSDEELRKLLDADLGSVPEHGDGEKIKKTMHQCPKCGFEWKK